MLTYREILCKLLESIYLFSQSVSSYKRPFPVSTTSRQQQQQQQSGDLALGVSNTAYSSSTDVRGSYWVSNSRSPGFPTSSARFAASNMMMLASQSDQTKPLGPRETSTTQGSNSSPYLPPKIKNFPHLTQQGITTTTNTNATNGERGINADLRLKREAPPISFGVADVMGFKTREEAAPLTNMVASNSVVYRGNGSPSSSSSSRPLRSSSELG